MPKVLTFSTLRLLEEPGKKQKPLIIIMNFLKWRSFIGGKIAGPQFLFPKHDRQGGFCHLVQQDVHQAQPAVCSAFSVSLCGDVCEGQKPLPFLLLLLPPSACRGSAEAGPRLPRGRRSHAGKTAHRASKAEMPRRKVSSNMLRLLASVPETKNSSVLTPTKHPI